MNIVFILVLLFFLGSFMGWILEFFFRRYFAPERKWCNPGFLAGSMPADIRLWNMRAVSVIGS